MDGLLFLQNLIIVVFRTIAREITILSTNDLDIISSKNSSRVIFIWKFLYANIV